MKGDILTDLRDKLDEFKNYIEDLYLKIRCPYTYEDHAFAQRVPGLKYQKAPVIVAALPAMRK
jgi:hypothetical protein